MTKTEVDMLVPIEIVLEQLVKLRIYYFPLAILPHSHSLYHHSSNLNIHSPAMLVHTIKNTLVVATHMLLPETIKNGMIFSAASIARFAVRLVGADYLKNQELSEGPVEFAMQCVSTTATYSLLGVVNFVLTKAILRDSKSIIILNTLGSISFGVAQCYNNYKSVYGFEVQTTTTGIVVPYIADAATLWSLRGYMNFDVSNTASLMISIKNAMSVAATTYAVHCISNIVIDVVPQEMKENYLEPIFDQVIQFNYVVHNIISNNCEQVSGLITSFFNNNNE